MSTNKEVVRIETIKTLAELFPEMTVLDLLEWIEYCKTLSKGVVNNDYQKNEVGTLRYNK